MLFSFLRLVQATDTPCPFESDSHIPVVSEKSIVLFWAVLKWVCAVRRYGDVFIWDCRSIRCWDKFTRSSDWSVASSGTTVHLTPRVPFKDRSDSQAALQ